MTPAGGRSAYSGSYTPAGAVPQEITGWHYDEVHRFFRDGHAAMTTDWPGYYGSYCDNGSHVKGRFSVARMPAGPRDGSAATRGRTRLLLHGRGKTIRSPANF